MVNSELVKNYYIGFLTNDNDPLLTFSCYDENHPSIKVTSKPSKKEIAYIFSDCNISDKFIHIFKVKEILSDFDSFGFKRDIQSQYLTSYSKEDLLNCNL